MRLGEPDRCFIDRAKRALEVVRGPGPRAGPAATKAHGTAGSATQRWVRPTRQLRPVMDGRPPVRPHVLADHRAGSATGRNVSRANRCADDPGAASSCGDRTPRRAPTITSRRGAAPDRRRRYDAARRRGARTPRRPPASVEPRFRGGGRPRSHLQDSAGTLAGCVGRDADSRRPRGDFLSMRRNPPAGYRFTSERQLYPACCHPRRTRRTRVGDRPR